MRSMLFPALVVVAASIGGYWHYSPHIALHGMQAAAESNNADKLNTYVDYPRLRESIKGELSASMATMMAEEPANEFEKAGAALGMMMGMALVDNLVDAMVRPEMVMRMLNEAKIQGMGETEPTSSSNTRSAATDKKDDITWVMQRKTQNLVVVYASNAEGQDELGVVLERSGFANWKVTGIRLPN